MLSNKFQNNQKYHMKNVRMFWFENTQVYKVMPKKQIYRLKWEKKKSWRSVIYYISQELKKKKNKKYPPLKKVEENKVKQK